MPKTRSRYLAARAKGIPVKPIDTPVLSIKAAAHGWLEDVKRSNRRETYELYENTIRQFQEWDSNGGPHRTNLIDLGRIGLVLYCPASLALFLEQRLSALGEITAYERRVSGGYQKSVVIETG